MHQRGRLPASWRQSARRHRLRRPDAARIRPAAPPDLPPVPCGPAKRGSAPARARGRCSYAALHGGAPGLLEGAALRRGQVARAGPAAGERQPAEARRACGRTGSARRWRCAWPGGRAAAACASAGPGLQRPADRRGREAGCSNSAARRMLAQQARAAGSSPGRPSGSGRRSVQALGRCAGLVDADRAAASAPRPSGRDRPSRRHGRRSRCRRGSGSCRRRSGCSAASRGTRLPSIFERPLSSSTTWYSSRAVEVAGAARAGGEGGVGRRSPGRWRVRASRRRKVAASSKRRHHLLDAGGDDVHARQRLRQVAVALVGDDDARAGLGDEEVGAGDADVGLEVIARAAPARASSTISPTSVEVRCGRAGGGARRTGRPPARGLVHGGHDDVAGRLVGELDDVFAEVGLDDLDSRRPRARRSGRSPR